MKHVKVLGAACCNCNGTVKLIDDVAKAMGVELTIEKVEKVEEIVGYGILSTPGVVVDGEVVHAGGTPSRAKVESWLAA